VSESVPAAKPGGVQVDAFAMPVRGGMYANHTSRLNAAQPGKVADELVAPTLE
jgi:hypothetical protein